MAARVEIDLDDGLLDAVEARLRRDGAAGPSSSELVEALLEAWLREVGAPAAKARRDKRSSSRR